MLIRFGLNELEKYCSVKSDFKICNLKTFQERTDSFPAEGGLSSPVVNLKLRLGLLFEEVSEGGGWTPLCWHISCEEQIKGNIVNGHESIV